MILPWMKDGLVEVVVVVVVIGWMSMGKEQYHHHHPSSSSTSSSFGTTRIGLLKIDVEGYEPHVLVGGRRLLESGRVENILLEFSVDRYEKDLAFEMMDILLHSGYQLKGVGSWSGRTYPGMLRYLLDDDEEEEEGEVEENDHMTKKAKSPPQNRGRRRRRRKYSSKGNTVPKSLGSSTTASNNNNGTKTMMRMTNPDDHQQLMNRLWNWKVAFPKKSDTSLNLWWGLLQE